MRFEDISNWTREYIGRENLKATSCGETRWNRSNGARRRKMGWGGCRRHDRLCCWRRRWRCGDCRRGLDFRRLAPLPQQAARNDDKEKQSENQKESAANSLAFGENAISGVKLHEPI